MSPEFVEATLFEAGATAPIVLPDTASFPDPQTIVIGREDTVPPSAAIAAALPFLNRARQVFLATVAEGGPEAKRHREPISDVAAHLVRSRVREMILGGVTRDLPTRSTLPLLVSH